MQIISGAANTGKTTAALTAVGLWQRANPGRRAAFIDLENRPGWIERMVEAKRVDVDLSQVVAMSCYGQVDAVLALVQEAIDSDVGLVVIDPMNMVSCRSDAWVNTLAAFRAKVNSVAEEAGVDIIGVVNTRVGSPLDNPVLI